MGGARPISGLPAEPMRTLRMKPPEKVIAVTTHLDEEL